jgi:arabinan endo-1,5-alpha-L-arabinosidase
MYTDSLLSPDKNQFESKADFPAPEKKRELQFYINPLGLQTPVGQAQQCADPTLIRGQAPDDPFWYLYCTGGPLNDDDRDADGNHLYRHIPIYRSLDLVHWQYQGDVFSGLPVYSAPGAGLWAPEIQYFNGRYHLYYVVTKTTYPGTAIGVATSDHPLGPWLDSGQPVVEPHPGLGTQGAPRWCYDPGIVSTDDGTRYIFYGSYFGGISARALSPDGLSSDPSTQVQITISNRYEAANVIKREGYYYLLASVTNACNGPLTGYAVFCGRSADLLGPYYDRDGHSLLSSRVGGTPVLTQNGNRWVGPGHEYVIEDFNGQTWMLYHAIDVNDPFFTNAEGAVENTVDSQKRPLLMDRLDWVDGWPVVLGGPSEQLQTAPASQPANGREPLAALAGPGWSRQASRDVTPHRQVLAEPARSGSDRLLDPIWADDFCGIDLDPHWTWIRPPRRSTYQLTNSCFAFRTQEADLYGSANEASLLTRDLPSFDCVVETRLSLDVPPDGVCRNFVQGGLVVYGDRSNFIKLAVVSIWETQQTEFAKATRSLRRAYPAYGNSVIGTPGDWTYLRIVRRRADGQEYYTGYTRATGKNWVQGATWTHTLGSTARLGLVSMGGSGFESRFDYVRIYRLEPQ